MTYSRQHLEHYANYIDMLMNGDTHMMEDMSKLMREDGFWDEDGFWISIDEEDE